MVTTEPGAKLPNRWHDGPKRSQTLGAPRRHTRGRVAYAAQGRMSALGVPSTPPKPWQLTACAEGVLDLCGNRSRKLHMRLD